MNIELGSVVTIGRVVAAPRFNLAEFRPMTVGDIGVSPRPFGWAISPKSYEIQNEVRIERYETIIENAKVAQPISSIMSQIEDVASNVWKATESDVQVALIWNEIRTAPDVTDEILARAFRAKADLMNRKLAAMPSNPESQAEPVISSKTEATHRQEAKTETRSSLKQEVKQKQEKHKSKYVPKTKKPKFGTIVFKKDESASAYRLARAKEKFKILHQEKNGGIVLGEELNDRLGFEIFEEKSRLLYQLGIKEREDGSNVRGFRRIIDRLMFNGLQDGYRKLYEVNENHDPVVIGGDGKIESEEAVEEVLEGPVDKKRVLKLEYPLEGESSIRLRSKELRWDKERILLNQAH